MNTTPPAARVPGSTSASKSGPNVALIGLAGIVLGLVVGYGTGRVSTGTPINPSSGKSGSYQEGYDTAHKKLLDSGLFPQIRTEARSLTGTITSISGDKIVLSVQYRSPDPLDETVVPKERTVTIGKETKITLLTQKDPSEFQKEMDAFNKARLDSPAGELQPPQPSSSKDIAISDLQPGDSITIDSDSDILTTVTFTASAITKNPAAPTQGGPGTQPIAPPQAP